MEDFITTLKNKEQELLYELQQSPLYKQWDSIRNTIKLFETQTQSVAHTRAKGYVPAIPTEYTDRLTWKEKILYVLSIIEQGYISDIIAQLKHLGATETDLFLEKRISTMASSLKTQNALDVKYDGKKAIYFLKK